MPASALTGATRLFLAGNAVAMTGNGLVIAFTLIYLHQARGIALPVVGVLLVVALSLTINTALIVLAQLIVLRLVQSLAFIVCHALATGFIAAGATAAWHGLLCAGCLGTFAVGVRLRRRWGQASPRADLGPGLRDRSARDPA